MWEAGLSLVQRGVADIYLQSPTAGAALAPLCCLPGVHRAAAPGAGHLPSQPHHNHPHPPTTPPPSAHLTPLSPPLTPPPCHHRYKSEIRAEDKLAIRELFKAQHHHLVTPEVLRELEASRSRGERASGPEAMQAVSNVGSHVSEDPRDLAPLVMMEEDDD